MYRKYFYFAYVVDSRRMNPYSFRRLLRFPVRILSLQGVAEPGRVSSLRSEMTHGLMMLATAHFPVTSETS
jgi:hypothetical protein